jgi:dihydrofolate reductase
MKASVFVGTSVDGFIARPNDDLDFLPAGGSEPHGYAEFMAGVDVLIIGRRTFDKIMTFEEWPYADQRVVVLTGRTVPPHGRGDARFEVMSGPPRDILARVEKTGATHAYVDGGLTIQAFLREGLIGYGSGLVKSECEILR